MSHWILHERDCLDVMAEMPDGSIGGVVTDPPYCSGSPVDKLAKKTTTEKYTSGDQKKLWHDFAGDQMDQRAWSNWCLAWLRECKRVVRPGGYVLVFIDWRQLPSMSDLVQWAGLTWRSLVVWDKGQMSRPPGLGRFRHQCEYVIVASNGKLSRTNVPFRCMPGCFTVPNVLKDKHHLTGKPTELMRRLVHTCPAGQKVFDPFAGSGTTGVAALLEGRKFVGCEVVPHYAQVARERLSKASECSSLTSETGRLFDAAVQPGSDCFEQQSTLTAAVS